VSWDGPLCLVGLRESWFYAGTQGLYSGGGEVLAGHLDGGQRRKHELSKVNIVKADDRDIVGHSVSGPVKAVENTDRRHVIGADDGGGHLAELQ